MCGIGAFQIVGNETSPAQVARVLLRLLEVRGRDASGVAWHTADGNTFVQKAAVNGKRMADLIDKEIGATGVVHTRWATQGTPENNANNHPIDASGIIGVHNGHITNDDELLKMCVDYKRAGQVDSESVFALIGHGNKEMKLRTRLSKVRGNAALLWLRSYDKNQRLHAARLTSSPLFFGQTALGSVVFASTKAIVEEVGKRCNLVFEYIYEMEQGTYVRVQDGVLSEIQNIELPKPSYVAAHDYTKRSVYAAPKQSKRDDLQWELPLNQNLRDALDRSFRQGMYGERW